MKTIKELRNEGLLSTRTYNALVRGINLSYLFTGKVRCFERQITREEIENLTVKDVFDLFTEEEMLNYKWRGFGQSCLNELKGLM